MARRGPIAGRRAYRPTSSRMRQAAQLVVDGTATVEEAAARFAILPRTVARAIEQAREEPTRVLTRALVEQLVFCDGLSMWGAARQLGLTRDAVRYHVRRLRAAGVTRAGEGTSPEAPDAAA